jgi:hypothetical protein
LIERPATLVELPLQDFRARAPLRCVGFAAVLNKDLGSHIGDRRRLFADRWIEGKIKRRGGRSRRNRTFASYINIFDRRHR